MGRVVRRGGRGAAVGGACGVSMSYTGYTGGVRSTTGGATNMGSTAIGFVALGVDIRFRRKRSTGTIVRRILGGYGGMRSSYRVFLWVTKHEGSGYCCFGTYTVMEIVVGELW